MTNLLSLTRSLFIGLLVFSALNIGQSTNSQTSVTSAPTRSPASIRLVQATPVTSTPQQPCPTWQTFRTAVQNGAISLGLPIPDLPANFQSGCIFADEGAHTLNIYVLANGTTPQDLGLEAVDIPGDYNRSLTQVIPQTLALGDDEANVFATGKILKVGFDSPGETDAAFIRENAWEKAYIYSSGLVTEQCEVLRCPSAD